MQNSGYLIPANSKRGRLIFSLFTPFDLILASVGIVITLILAIAIPLDNIFISILVFIPGGLAVFLVTPVPNYHNVMTFLGEIYAFYNNNRVYYWKGWCFGRGGKEDK